MKKYILAIDQGTTSCRTIIFDEKADVVSVSQKEFEQIFPNPGWVEHSPTEIWETQLFTMKEAIKKASLGPGDITSIGITNQRETTVIWEKKTGKPIYNAIVWQCRRTASICEELKKENLEGYIKEATGLVIDAYFSATKIKWILDNVKGAKKLLKEDRLLFGTIDTWLVYNLTKGESHITDYTNASRTMLYNIKDLCWDEKILDALDIPKSILPKVVDSSGNLAVTHKDILGREIPITGIAGDQQAALFGQGCFLKGEGKNTYGTGCFLLMNTGEDVISSNYGLLTTIACGINGEITYALEGSVFMGGALIQWLRDSLNLIKTSSESYEYAISVKDTAGVYIVPAFAGLGAPYWDMYATGLITGLTRATTKAHIIRASLEAIAYQVRDLVQAMSKDSNVKLTSLMVDGGACKNDFLMQFQSDILGCLVDRPQNVESTALGAAFLSGLASKVWESKEEIKKIRKIKKIFKSEIPKEKREDLYNGWVNAVNKSRSGENKEALA